MREKLFQRKLKKMQKRGERYKREYELKEAYAKYLPERKKRKVSNILLVIIVMAITIYTVASFWLTYVTGITIDGTLTTCFYTFFGSELCLIAGIKISKIRSNHDNSPYEQVSNDEPEDDEACG